MSKLKEERAKKKAEKQLKYASFEELVKLAKKYYLQRELKKAIYYLTQAIKLKPDYSDAYNDRGLCFFENKQYDLALNDYSKAIELNAIEAKYYSNRGLCFFEKKQYDSALSDYNKAIALNPNYAEAYYNRGLFYFEHKLYELALENYRKTVALNLKDADVYNNIALCYSQQRQYNLALDYYKLAIALSPNNIDIYYNRGACYLEQKQYELALKDYNKSILLNPNDNESYINRGTCFSADKQYELALNDYNHAIHLNPKFAVAYINRGTCYLEQSQYELALKDYNKAIELNFKTYKVYSNLCLCYIGLKNYDSAIFYLNDAINIAESFEIKKDICLTASGAFTTAEQFDAAREFVELAFNHSSSKEQQYKEIYLDNIHKTEELNKKNKELNNLIAMFAHNFLGILQSIRSNAQHENNPKIHLKNINMMSSALTAFSIISADDDKLIEQLKQDNTGDTTLQQNITNNLALAISQLLSKTNKDKIINLYLNYLRKTQQIAIDTDSETLRENKDYRKKWQALQHQWEDEFNALFSENVELSALQKWIETNFFPVQIIGFDNYTIRFKEYGITDSIFMVIFTEIILNALKYSDVSQNKPFILMLCKDNQYYQFTCENPSAQETDRGTHKGMDFLNAIARKLNAQLITETTENSFKTTFIISAELLD
ncbi:MAG: tetratricopeptide repeat protein [Methylococcaceae bacterium]